MSEVIIGREPTIILPDGTIENLPVHRAFQDSTSKRRILVIHRRGRKTSIALEEVFKYLLTNKGIVGKTLAPIRKQAKETIWDDPDMVFSEHICPKEIIANRNDTELKITLKNGSIYYLDGADNPHSHRGGNVKVLHLAETGDHKEEVWTQVYEPVLKQNGGVAIFEGNPRGRNWYYRLFENVPERKGWERFILSARNSPFFSQEELLDSEKSLPYNVFASEYLCEWVDSSGTVFRGFDRLATATAKEPELGKKYRFGVDLGRLQDFTVLCGIDRTTWEMVAFERFNQLDWTIQKERIKSLARKYSKRENKNEVELVVEYNGVGDPIFNDLWQWAASEKEYAITMTPFHTSQASKAMLVSNLSMMFDESWIRILPEENLLKELENFTYRKTQMGFIYEAPSTLHDDCVMSLMIMAFNLGAKIPIADTRIINSTRKIVDGVLVGGGEQQMLEKYLI